MLIRTIVGAALVPVMLLILVVCPAWVLPCFYALLAAIAQHELLFTTGVVKNRLVIALCAVTAAAIPFAVYFAWPAASLTALMLALTIALFVIAMNTGKTFDFMDDRFVIRLNIFVRSIYIRIIRKLLLCMKCQFQPV